MAGRTRMWYAQLSKGSKVALWLVATFVGASVAGAGTSPSQSTTSPIQLAPASQETNREPANVTEVKTMTVQRDMPYEEVTVNDASIDRGTSRMHTIGEKGKRVITYEVTYKNSVEQKRKVIKDEITKQPTNQVMATGTKEPYTAPVVPQTTADCDPNYSPCIPRVSYDLDCGDIGVTVRVIGSDIHRLDRDRDGHGCE